MNAWDDGPPDTKDNEEGEDDRSDKIPRPCNATLLRKIHKRQQQNVWLPYMKKIWNKIDDRPNAIPAEEKLLIQEIPKLGGENEKNGLPTTLGLLPVSNITNLWRQVKKGQMNGRDARNELKSLWRRFQFADGFCNLPPTEGGEYPTKADIEDEYRERTGRDPQTGHLIEQEQQGNKAGKARGGKTTEHSKTYQKGKSKKGPSAREKAAEKPVSNDTEMEEAAEEPINSDTEMAEDSEASASEDLTSRKRKQRKKKGHTSQAIVPINPYSSLPHRGKPVQIWTSSEKQERTFRPGYTSSGHRIIAYGKIAREEIADSKEVYHRTTRNYVIRKGKDSYTIQSESDCGGPEIWELLPDKIKEERRIGQNSDAIPNRRQLPHMKHGISWLAMGKCGTEPSRLPPIACEIFWQHEGQQERRAIIWRTQLHKIFGRDNADWHLGKVITPRGQEPPRDLWTAIKCFQPHIEPTVRVSQKMLPAASSLLLPQPSSHQGQPTQLVREEREREIERLTKELKRLKMHFAGSSGANADDSESESGWDTPSEGKPDAENGSDPESGWDESSNENFDAENGSDSDESIDEELLKGFQALKKEGKKTRSKRKGE
jgi:hypothetical protein